MNRLVVVFLIVILAAVGSSLLIPQVRDAFVRLGVMQGQLSVSGVAPKVIALYMQDITDPPYTMALLTSAPAGAPLFSPKGDLNKTIRLNATVISKTGDCQSGFTWYVCTNDTGQTSTCRPAVATYVNSSATPVQQWTCLVDGATCTNCCCNYTATIQLEYYKYCGLSAVNGTGTTVSGYQNSTLGYWKSNDVIGMYYPYDALTQTIGNVINLGGVNVGTWNPGLAANYTKNGGNIKFKMFWNATNFTGGTPPDVIPIYDCGSICVPPETGNTTFAVDNDTLRMSNGFPGYISPDNKTQIQYPTYNVLRCGNYGCSQDERKIGLNWASFQLWWHLWIESGKSAGTYTNTIQLNYTQVECGT
jgi:hypothetical protein